ncbi:MAG: AAA family ATPase [Bacteroidota bacterium]
MAKKEKDKTESKTDPRFKLRSMRTYSSSEWMTDSTKKYRCVFEKAESTYLWSEFSFFNKKFDEEEWEAPINMKCFSLIGDDKKELCNLDSKRVVKTDENVVCIHEGWGNKEPGVYWNKGDYVWEAYIDNQMIADCKFYVEEVGKVTIEENPYFDIVSLKLFNGPFDGVTEADRKYIKVISRSKAQYIWAELKIKNKTHSEWNCELFCNFFDDADQLKGHSERFQAIEKNKKGDVYTIDAGWGSDTAGSWKDDRYKMNIVFMDVCIASIVFDSHATDEEEGDPEILTSILPAAVAAKVGSAEQNETLEDVMKNLEELIGLQDIKTKIKEHINYLNFIKLRKEKGFEDTEKITLHSVFTGNPGTGKTTVVQLLGKIYQKMGLLSKGHVHEVGRADLCGEFIGQTAPKTKEQIEKARGGILFIDEAYMLAREGDDNKDFGKEAIEVLLKEMSDGKGDIAIMVAGYPKQMENFIDSNPGMKSRFKYYFHFDDYMPDELMQIMQLASEKRKIKFLPEATNFVQELIVEAYRNRDNTFGNARFSYGIVDEAKLNMGLRLMKNPDIQNLDNEVLSTVTLEDVEKISLARAKKKLHLTVNDKLLREAMEELNSMVGVTNIKNEINELVKLVSYYNETGKDVLNKFSLHTVFMGNPGTGKTTVARIIGKIYKALGLLERGHIVECDREGLVAGYIGQTAIKTKEKIDQAMGGVMFIDEAYSLTNGGNQDFGREAIEILLKSMEDNRGKFALIVAGYPDNMSEFLKSNPGLSSRFDHMLKFEDYTAQELFDIGLGILAKESLKPDADASVHLLKYIEGLVSFKDKYFGNARTIRSMMGDIVKHQNLRMASLESSQRTAEMMRTVSIPDVEEFKIEEKRSNEKSIGFRY